jgi:hypothetical protein
MERKMGKIVRNRITQVWCEENELLGPEGVDDCEKGYDFLFLQELAAWPI